MRIAAALRSNIWLGVVLGLIATASSPSQAKAVCTTFVAAGAVSGATWDLAGSPYCVEGDITVSDLIVDPGVKVYVDGAFKIAVQTWIKANGTPALPILFSAKLPAAPDNQRWRGLKFDPAGPGSEFRHTTIEYSNDSGMLIRVAAAPVLENCVFRNNSSSSFGGAIQALNVKNDMTIYKCTFSQNTSDGPGGALSIGVDFPNVLQLDRVLIEGNTANPSFIDGMGASGGLYFFNGVAKILNSVFRDNRANSACSVAPCGVEARSGALYVHSATNVTVENSEFIGNVAHAENLGACTGGAFSTSYAGAIWVHWGGSLTMSNSIIACNATTATDCNATREGAGIYVSRGGGSNADLTNTTVARNSSTGLATEVFSTISGTINMRNGIVYHNNGGGSQSSGIVTADYSDVQNGHPGSGNIALDPAFAGPACDPGHLDLLPGSPAIDAGDADLPFIDLCHPPSAGTDRNDMGSEGGPLACNSDRDHEGVSAGLGDGVPHGQDNCRFVANTDQWDSNQDGFGNICDPDTTNDGQVGITDFNEFRLAFGKNSSHPDFDPDSDYNGDDAVGILDFNILRNYFGGPPGPSGLGCAGTVPCP